MTPRRTLFREYFKHHAPAALLCLGLGALGCSGGHFNLSSRVSRGEEIAADAQRDVQQVNSGPEATSLARLLRMKREEPADKQETAEPRNGRIFSAFVDRRTPESDGAQDPFLAAEAEKPAARRDDATRTVTRSSLSETSRESSGDSRATGQQKLSDADLWKMLESEKPVRADSAPARVSVAPTPAADTPEWARESNTPAPAGSTTTGYQTPAFAQAEAAGPPADPVPAPQASAPPPAAADSLRTQVDALLAEARRHEGQGALHEAYHAAILAERLADREQLVFTPQQEQPADLARRLAEKMQTAPRRDPFGEISIGPNASQNPASEVSATTPAIAASTQFPGAASPQSGTHAPPSAEVAAIAPQRPAAPSLGFDEAFPPVHEWRGVKANTPVSLAVVDTSPAPFRRAPEPVEHAVLKAPAEDSTSGDRLPRRLEPHAGSLWLGRPETSSLSGPSLSGPALIRESDASAPSSVAPPPPLDVGAEHRRVAEPGRSDRAETRQRRGGMTWWVFGAVALFAGAVLVRVRRGRTMTPA